MPGHPEPPQRHDRMKKDQGYSPILIALLYAIAFALIMGANPFNNQNVSPVQLFQKYPGWASHQFSSPPSHSERSDILDLFIPQKKFFKESLLNGNGLTWNDLPSGGRPAVWEPSRSYLNIPSLAFILLPDIPGYYAEILIKLIICAFGMYLLLRCWIGKTPAFIGGLIFALCGFNISWLHWPHVTTSMWGPWLFWATLQWFKSGQIRYLFANAFILISMFLGGFPAVFAYFIYAEAFLLAILILQKNDYENFWKKMIALCAVFAASLLILAPFILNLHSLLSSFDLSYRKGGSALYPKDWRIALYPKLSGVEKNYYSGILAVTGALLVAVLAPFSPKRYRLPVFLGLILLMLTAILALQILPPHLTRKIPAIGNSPFNRLGIIYGFSVALLFAIGMQWLMVKSKNKLLIYGLLVLACIQIMDQSRAFKHFNSVANGEDFYPRTPVIDHVVKNIHPLQSGFFNNHYLMPGTLTYYGIRDWFAHEFRTNQEKKVIRELFNQEPFASPTTINPKPHSIQLDSDLFEKLGIRYATLDNKEILARGQRLINNKPAAAMDGKEKSNAQVILLESPIRMKKFGVLLGTYRGLAPNDVKLTIYSNDEVIASASPSHEITDNKEAIFEFDTELELEKGEYVLAISFTKTPGRNITAWFTENIDHPTDYILINGIKNKNSAWIYSIYSSPPEQIGKWTMVKNIQEPLITLYENKNTPAGPYFSKDLEDREISDQRVFLKSYRPNQIEVNYLGREKGYIILPIRHFTGWSVENDSQKAIPEKYLGMLLAAKVDGPAELKFSYDPPFLRIGLLLSAFGVFILIMTALLYRRSETPS